MMIFLSMAFLSGHKERISASWPHPRSLADRLRTERGSGYAELSGVGEMELTGRRLQREELERLLGVGRALVSELDLDSVLRHVLDAARELTGARYAALGVLDEGKAALERFVYIGIDEETRRQIGPLPRGHGILGELIREPRMLRLARVSDHPRSYGFPAEHPAMTTFLGTPVMIHGEVYGNLYLTEKEGGTEFDERDEELVAVLAEWAAIGIDNARTHELIASRRAELERALRGLQATASLDRELGGETDLDRVLELVVKRSRALVDAKTCLVLLTRDEGLAVGFVAGEVSSAIIGRRVDARGGAAAEVLAAGAGQRVGPMALGPFRDLGIEGRAGLLVPLTSRGRRHGVIVAIDRIGDEPTFSGDDQLAMESFGTSAAAAISGALAVEDERLRQSIASSERERGRWARELHDETLQELGALQVLQEGALKVNRPDAMRDALESANVQVRRVIEGLQGLITELRPAALDQLGIAAALESLAERQRARSGLDVGLDVALASDNGERNARLAPELEATIYRVVQEGLTNVAKHAKAEHVRVAVEERSSRIRILVEDDGRGIGRGEDGGFGLVGMRERVELVNGEMTVEPGAAGGTRLAVTLPVISRPAPPGP
jgi:signal transduction histidine kinase